MFDQLSKAYEQMQPGDKLVMQMHKSPKPPTPQYQMPTPAGPDAGAAPPAAPVSAMPMPMAGPMAQPVVDPMAQRQALIAALASRFGGRV